MSDALVIAVGSSNPVKLGAVKKAAENIEGYSEENTQGFEVASGVAAQPKTDQETRTGARNRAATALKNLDGATLGVGLEGGVFTAEDGQMYSTVWVAVTPNGEQWFEANGMRFPLPTKVAEMINQGMEMSDAMDQLTGLHKTKHGLGMVGIITGGLVDRTEAYAAIAKLALGQWVGQHWQNAA
jgi:inosine/xanthosine triphosphatase